MLRHACAHRINHGRLHRANISDDRASFQRRRHRRDRAAHCAHRHGEHHEISIGAAAFLASSNTSPIASSRSRARAASLAS
jgi:hypothetical protein